MPDHQFSNFYHLEGLFKNEESCWRRERRVARSLRNDKCPLVIQIQVWCYLDAFKTLTLLTFGDPTSKSYQTYLNTPSSHIKYFLAFNCLKGFFIILHFQNSHSFAGLSYLHKPLKNCALRLLCPVEKANPHAGDLVPTLWKCCLKYLNSLLIGFLDLHLLPSPLSSKMQLAISFLGVKEAF